MKLADSIDKYKEYEMLGKGGFAEVYRAVELENGTEVAIKKISKQSIRELNMKDRVTQEVQIHIRLKHPSIVKLYTCIEDSSYIYLIMELCPNGQLLKLLDERSSPFSESQARGVLKQVLAGLKYLHSHRIIHRDLTLSNLLLTRDWAVKIADFGLAVEFTQPDQKQKTMCGTPNYIAPEVINRKEQGPETDIWNVGIMLYTLLVGKPPFDTNYGGVQTTFKKVVSAEITWPSNLSPEVINLMDFMLQKDPTQRISLNDILKHPFMTLYPCEDLRMIAPPSITSSCSYGDSGFLTTPSTWFTAGTRNSSANNVSLPTKGALRSCTDFKQLSCCSSSYCSLPHRPPIWKQRSMECSHASKSCNQCSHVENCPCLMVARGSHSGCSNANSQCHCVAHSSSSSGQMKPEEKGAKEVPQPSSGFNGPVRIIPPDIPVPPLNTTRLRPKLRASGKAVLFSILDTGEVCLEFYKEKHNYKKIIEVMLISADGMKIWFQHPYDYATGEPGRGQTSVEYSYETLPEKFLKKYLFALKSVANEKAVTPKITYYSPLGKCQLMENSPDPNFVVSFYSGGKVIKKGSQAAVLDEDYKVIGQYPISFDGNELEQKLKPLWDHFKTCWEECLEKEKDLEDLSLRRKGVIWFPNTSGQKPLADPERKDAYALEQTNKENLPPAQLVSTSRRVAGSAPSSLVGRSSSSQTSSNRSSKLLKKVTIPDIGTAFQMTNGLVSVHFTDKTKLEVKPSLLRGTTLFTFTDAHGQNLQFRVDSDGSSNHIPADLRDKISLYGIMVQKLKNLQ